MNVVAVWNTTREFRCIRGREGTEDQTLTDLNMSGKDPEILPLRVDVPQTEW